MGKVLVIDDDPSYGEMLIRHFKHLGHEVRLCRSLSEARSAAVEFAPEAVYLDVGLPDGSGLSFIDELKDLPSRPEVIIVTGRGSADGAELAIRSGAWNYLCKGGSSHELVFSLQQALEFRKEKRAAAPRALDLGGMIGKSRAIQACFDQVAQAASTDANVLVTGESGSGKEMLALAIHRNSRRQSGGYVVVDCAALPDSLVESVLFGHRKGSFTGAVDHRVGLLEQAHTGTLFLDEVGEMPLAVQKTFLRALQERRFRPVGGDREIESDFRLIAATNRNLEQLAVGGAFREDLLFRLRAIEIRLPPLRERGEDVREIAQVIVARICDREGMGTKGISPEFYDVLTHYEWPGNVRELVNAMEHAVAQAKDHHTLYATHLPTNLRVHAARRALAPVSLSSRKTEEAPLVPLQEHLNEATRQYLNDLVTLTEGHMKKACAISGVSRSRLYVLLKQFQGGKSAELDDDGQ